MTLRELRREAGLTLAQVAKGAGGALSTYAALELHGKGPLGLRLRAFSFLKRMLKKRRFNQVENLSLRELREKAGLTQEQLSKMIPCHLTSIGWIERHATKNSRVAELARSRLEEFLKRKENLNV